MGQLLCNLIGCGHQRKEELSPIVLQGTNLDSLGSQEMGGIGCSKPTVIYSTLCYDSDNELSPSHRKPRQRHFP